MNAENTLMDEKSSSALKNLMAFGLYSVVIVVGAVSGMIVLLFAA